MVIENPSSLAVRDILLNWKDSGEYKPRYSGNNTGYIDDGSVHAPIIVHKSGFNTDRIQFVIEPNEGSPGADPKAITLGKVNDYYASDPIWNYWYTINEPAQYVIYTLDYGYDGFNITVVERDRRGKPLTWRITPVRNPELYVNNEKFEGTKEILVDQYPAGVSFELVVSLKPISKYPSSGASLAPGKPSNLSNT